MLPSNLHSPILLQLYQSKQSQYVYQYIKEKKIYQINEKDFKNRPQGFYTTFDSIGEKVNYFNKDFKEVIANFVGIETVYLRYNSSFSFKLQLYKYLKASCVGTIQTTLFSLTQSILSISIVELKVIIPSLGLGLVF